MNDDAPRLPLAARTPTAVLAPGHKLHATLATKLKNEGGEAARDPSALGGRALGDPDREAPWDAPFFGLSKVSSFSSADEEVRRAVLAGCARTLLSEAQEIERLGLTFCAKMCLLSETTEERLAYSLMSADEAVHFSLVSTYLGDAPSPGGGGPFHSLLRTAIEEQSKNVLTLLIQVVLEGWGLTHYRNMAEGTRDPKLAAVLLAILKDEAFHHGAGNVLFSGSLLTPSEESFVVSFLSELLDMVRIGPQAVVATLAKARGDLGEAARTTLFTELETEKTTAEKLAVLRALLERHDLTRVLRALDDKNAFVPYTPSVCARVSLTFR